MTNAIRKVSVDKIHDQCRLAARLPQLVQEASVRNEPIQEFVDLPSKQPVCVLMANAVSPSGVGVGSPKQPALRSSPPVADAVYIGRLEPEGCSDLTRID